MNQNSTPLACYSATAAERSTCSPRILLVINQWRLRLATSMRRASDLITVNSLSNTASVLLNNGDGSFPPTTNYVIGSSVKQVVLADFDLDGDLDTASVHSTGAELGYLRGNGDGSFNLPRAVFWKRVRAFGAYLFEDSGIESRSRSLTRGRGPQPLLGHDRDHVLAVHRLGTFCQNQRAAALIALSSLPLDWSAGFGAETTVDVFASLAWWVVLGLPLAGSPRLAADDDLLALLLFFAAMGGLLRIRCRHRDHRGARRVTTVTSTSATPQVPLCQILSDLSVPAR